jgi:hypothetical protein
VALESDDLKTGLSRHLFYAQFTLRTARIDVQAFLGAPPATEPMWIMAVYVLVVVIRTAIDLVLDVAFLRRPLAWVDSCGSLDRTQACEERKIGKLKSL